MNYNINVCEVSMPAFRQVTAGGAVRLIECACSLLAIRLNVALLPEEPPELEVA